MVHNTLQTGTNWIRHSALRRLIHVHDLCSHLFSSLIHVYSFPLSLSKFSRFPIDFEFTNALSPTSIDRRTCEWRIYYTLLMRWNEPNDKNKLLNSERLFMIISQAI